ncbi:dolichyl-phosphate-mannose--protein mannosyltransferase [Xylanimonas ulmi]|uniref:Polyprenol-phosphate-mannose--protein mannosyltransferase n=1 Tax=Xylanimonas ulmi TaxID=228973 RepID=A0A4Q7M4F4_9MICO|nr:phospholipid carrier-dependent glycosyltransferase [Xylanibacterium ulmi]RZS61893.1 dolichyl-phosphate-mannose-protein mannosyltransferase [Xylanibacterium ulmi]
MTDPQEGRPWPATGAPDPASESPLVDAPPPVRARQVGQARRERGLFAPTAAEGIDLLPTRERLLRALIGRRRLALGTARHDRLVSWVGTAVIVLLAAVTRLVNLGRPHALVFDETYYVKDAFTLWRLGFEAQWPQDPNPGFIAGNVETFLDQATYVVHPQVGKWLIALGMELGGGPTSSAAWRLANAVVGVLAVLLVIRIARRLFASTGMGLVAGLLMAVDGEAIVHSRTALLDQFVMFFALVAFGCLLLDREWARRRLADRMAALVDAGSRTGAGETASLLYGPRLGFRWWRLAAGVSLGLACGVKWSGIYFLAVFGVLTVLWDLGARRAAGVRRWWEDALIADGVPAFLTMVPTAAAVYVASWWSWFARPDSYLRQWAALNPGEGVTWLPAALRSWVHYHQQMWAFHTTLVSDHDYKSNPIGWIVQWRPTSFYWQPSEPGTGGCADGSSCTAAVTSLGNPLLWWLAALAIIAVIILGITRRDWRALAVLSGTIAGWVPWVVTYADTQRTVFTFYSIAFTPWVVLTLVYVGVVALEHSEHQRRLRRQVVAAIVVVVVAICAVSALFYPLWTAQEVSIEYWRGLMRLRSWI